LEDPKYSIIVPVRAYGQYGLRVNDPEKFVYSLVGNRSDFNEAQLQAYFRGVLLSKLTEVIASKITTDKISVLDIPAHLGEISSYSENKLKPYFSDYGLDLLLFNFISINIPENDPSLNEIKKAKNLSARLKITGKDNYKMERSFDVMDKAAQNESGAGAAFINAGLGFGATMNIGKQMADQLSPEQNSTPPPIPVNAEYYLAINGKQAGPYTAGQIQQAINNDPSVLKLLAWKKGMTSWANLDTFSEFDNPQQSGSVPPPIPDK
jgi:membrane protease subunit (stomatin/prohibitin family)